MTAARQCQWNCGVPSYSRSCDPRDRCWPWFHNSVGDTVECTWQCQWNCGVPSSAEVVIHKTSVGPGSMTVSGTRCGVLGLSQTPEFHLLEKLIFDVSVKSSPPVRRCYATEWAFRLRTKTSRVLIRGYPPNKHKPKHLGSLGSGIRMFSLTCVHLFSFSPFTLIPAKHSSLFLR